MKKGEIMMQFVIDTNKVVKKVNNFWNHIHFHPTDAIEDEWGQRILNRVAEDKVAKTVRMYAMLEDIVTMSPEGELQYDFTLNDQRLDYMVSKGFDIFLSYNFIPPCIAANKDELATVCKNKTRYKGKFIVTSPPKDYRLWEEICREYTRHIVERYGIETVSKWELQCFNEPDIALFFMRDERDIEKRAAEYCKLYDFFEKGVLSVSEKLCIGGPALATQYEFLEYFLNHIRNNGRRLDFICFHTYGTEPPLLQDGSRPFNVRNNFERINKVKSIAQECGFGNIKLIADEWGAASCGFIDIETHPQMIFRETEEFAAYFSKMLTILDESDNALNKMLICLSGQHEMTIDFSGFRGLFTLNFFAKPIYNAYKLAAKLGDEKLYCDKPFVGENYSVFPTKKSDGSVSVLLAHCADDLRGNEEEEITLKFKNVSGKARIWIIDEDNSNAFSAFKKMGSPEELSDEQILEIRKAGECEPIDCLLSNDNSIKFIAKKNSVALVEIVP